MKTEIDTSLSIQPSEEFMIQEFGLDATRLHVAKESIRLCACGEGDIDHESPHYSAPEVARVLMDCGLIEAFTIYCLRPGANGGRFAVLSSWIGSRTDGDMLTIRAGFEDSGVIKMLEGEIDSGEPFGMFLEGMLVLLPDHQVKDAEWRKAQWDEIRRYEADCACLDSYPWNDLVVVVRFPLSPTMAFRKFLTERWHDPDVPQSERFACSLDREVWERFQSQRSSVASRFQRVLDEIDRI